MKISELNIDELTDEQLRNLVLINPKLKESDKSKVYVVVLGGYPKTMFKRIKEAQSLYEEGYTNFILLGGKGWRIAGEKLNENSILKTGVPDGKLKGELEYLKTMKPFENLEDEELLKKTEAEIMKQFAINLGIPERCIKKEWFSTNTLENMENLVSHIEGTNCEKIIIVTSLMHLARAKLTLLNVSECAIEVEGMGFESDYPIDEIRKEAKRIQTYIAKGDVFDADVDEETCEIIFPKISRENNDNEVR